MKRYWRTVAGWKKAHFMIDMHPYVMPSCFPGMIPKDQTARLSLSPGTPKCKHCLRVAKMKASERD